MPSNQTAEQSSLFKKIGALIKRAVAWLFKPFAWIFKRKQNNNTQSNSENNTPQSLFEPPKERSLAQLVEDPSLKSRLSSIRQRIEALKKYQDSESKFSVQVKGLINTLEQAEKTYSIRQLLPKSLDGVESSISKLEQSIQEMIVYQKSYLAVLLPPKVKEFQLLVNMLPEVDEGQKKRKGETLKALQEMIVSLEQENTMIAKLSSLDQEVAYTSEKREMLIKNILNHLEMIPAEIGSEKKYQEDVHKNQMAQPLIQDEIQRPALQQTPVAKVQAPVAKAQDFSLPLYRAQVMVRLIGMKRMPFLPGPPPFMQTPLRDVELYQRTLKQFDKVHQLYHEECTRAMDQLQASNTKEEFDASANALIVLYEQADRLWDKAVAQEANDPLRSSPTQN